MSTVSPGVSRRLADEHARHNQNYFAAPVLGNPDFARERKLFILAGGPPSPVAKVRPLLERLGQRLFVIREHAELANFVKLAANTLTATTLECMGEVLALLRKVGIDQHLTFDVLTNSLFDSRVHKAYGGKIVDGRFNPPRMAVPLAIKDLRSPWQKPSTQPCRCLPPASFMTVSSRWRPAAGTISTGRRSVCSPP
jgi:3-hydroxyisobutyrate dehydrogenase-like beta-hydroxyacid dehydrogenase